MLIRTAKHDFNFGLRHSDVTPQELYLNRRKFMAAGAAALGSLALPGEAGAAPLTGVNKTSQYHKLLDDGVSPKASVTTYNNYYEFGTGQGRSRPECAQVEAEPGMADPH